jgi:hypothetical protein
VSRGLPIAYALVVDPVLGLYLGPVYPRALLYGVAPCPTAIFACGLLLWTGPGVPTYLLVLPHLWAAVGTPAAIGQGVIEDTMLPVAVLLRSPCCAGATGA